MAFAPRKKTSARRFSPRTLGVLGGLTVGASLLTAPQALAADTPTNAELLKACNWADARMPQRRPMTTNEWIAGRYEDDGEA